MENIPCLTNGLTDGPEDATTTVILAHGANAPMDSPFMDAWALGIAAAGLRCIRFEFPYMASRRRDGSKRPPNRLPVLLEAWQQVIRDVAATYAGTRIFIGGKSMGGRMASMLVCDPDYSGPPVHGLICLGYPFHPAGRPEKLRIEHLAATTTPGIIIQGVRDALGNRQEVSGYPLCPKLSLHWLEDGDHSFKPRKASGRTEAGNWQEGIEALLAFVEANSQ